MGDTPAKTIVQKMMISALGERNYSAQEVMHINMSWPLYRASREFVTLTSKDDEWSDILFDQFGGNTRVCQSLSEKYMTRAIDLLPDESIFYFAKKSTKERTLTILKEEMRLLEYSQELSPILTPKSKSNTINSNAFSIFPLVVISKIYSMT